MNMSVAPRLHTSVQQAKISQENLNKIPCPNLRTLVNEGWLTPDKDGLVDLKQLDQALTRLGVEGLAKKTLVDGAGKATAEAVAEQFGGMAAGKFNIYKLYGSNLDHEGDTRVLRKGQVDMERLDWLCSFANKDGRMTLSSIAPGQKEAAADEKSGLRAKLLGLAELTALIRVYGTPDKNGEKSISVDGLRKLYAESKFPDEWRARLTKDKNGVEGVSPQKTGLWRLLTGVISMAFNQIGTSSGRAKMGMDMSLNRDPQLNQTSAMGLGAGICPAGPPTALPKNQAEQAHGAN
jgi:hypothetical protein